MGNQTKTTAIEINRSVAEALATTPAARGLSLEDFLWNAGGLAPDRQAPPDLGVEEFDRWLDELAVGSDTPGSLPADFSRADVYDDHD